MKLTDIFRKKSEIEKEIVARKAAALNAEKALLLCDQLERDLPAKIAALESEPILIAFSPYAPVEDFTGRHDLVAQRAQIVAARGLLADIPSIRSHWVKLRDAR